jgi:hypothetical protein
MDADTTLVVDGMVRRNRIEDRAYRAGTWRRPWDDGTPWPAWAEQPYQWGLAEAEQRERDQLADWCVTHCRRYLAQLEREAAARRARRARRAWKLARIVAPELTRRWRRYRRRR